MIFNQANSKNMDTKRSFVDIHILVYMHRVIDSLYKVVLRYTAG